MNRRRLVSTRAVRSELASLQPAWFPSTPSRLRAIRRRMHRLTTVFSEIYRTPDLGNLPDPLDETVFIVMTYQTTLERARAVWRVFKTRFPTWQSVLDARAETLEEVLEPGGFHRARTALIKRLLLIVKQRCGSLSLRTLEYMTDRAAEAELLALPGLDLKGARCVLLYSLARAVFPVDSNIYRFMQRYGVLAESARYRRKATHDRLQELVAPDDRHRLHVNLVVHGRTTCLPRNPRCSVCVVRRTCPSRAMG